ncbi:Major Facilitator Superfamily [Geosmithia morbida]|uniref:Major Facilitator Superfamily n=1 Tax=Geosmithia morbida TaxID=1094350 RepID=A0A9P5D681_9HYPO|nr:Major Facilitator Superfamily [Geosmithia morbida]KAF4124505.1 Major Facilitator Superfamily [Geosmithia morbida]
MELEIHDVDDEGNRADGTATVSDLEKVRTRASSRRSRGTRGSHGLGSDADETYPEGGAQAWIVVLGSWFALLSSLGLMNTIALFQAYVLDHQLRGHSEGTVGWVFSIYTFLVFFCGIYIGPVFDKYGPRWLIVAGTAFTVGGVVSLSFCTKLWHFILSFGVLCGIGSSLLFTPSIASLGHWFKARRGLATGLASTGGGVGGVVFPLMQTALFGRVGYMWTTLVLALICLVGCIAGLALVRSRLPPSVDASTRPDFRIFRQKTFLLTTLGLFTLEFALFVPLTFISTYAVHQGFSQSFAFHLIPILNAGSIVGRALPGYYADVIGPFNTCIGSILLSIVSCLCVWLPSGSSPAGLIVFAVLFGFASGNGVSISPVCIGRLCHTNEYGRYYATAYTIVSFATLIGIPIAGNIVQADGGDYQGLIIFTGALYAVSLCFFVWAKCSALGWAKWAVAY